MPSIGPELPPHLARSQEQEDTPSTSPKPSIGPQLPPHLSKRDYGSAESDVQADSPGDTSEPPTKRTRTIGPSLPPHLASSSPRDEETQQEQQTERSRRTIAPSLPSNISEHNSSHELDKARAPSEHRGRRILGPAPPPASLDERPSTPASDDDDTSDSDSDYGPAPPDAHNEAPEPRRVKPQSQLWDKNAPLMSSDANNAPPQRDAWMTMPPKADDLAGHMDPLKQRARKFNTKPSAGRGGGGGGGGGVGAMWTETPEEKRKRLENEVLGTRAPSPPASSSSTTKKAVSMGKDKREGKTEKKGPSLYEQHKRSSKREEVDDPTKRAFDWEKDMAISTGVTHKQKRELINNAKNMGGRFSEGSYL